MVRLPFRISFRYKILFHLIPHDLYQNTTIVPVGRGKLMPPSTSTGACNSWSITPRVALTRPAQSAPRSQWIASSPKITPRDFWKEQPAQSFTSLRSSVSPGFRSCVIEEIFTEVVVVFCGDKRSAKVLLRN